MALVDLVSLASLTSASKTKSGYRLRYPSEQETSESVESVKSLL